MRISYNIAHWLCLFAGLYLIVMGLIAKTHVDESAVTLRGKLGQGAGGPTIATRMILVGIGAAVVAYGVMRIIG